jgi:hypothetical protein
MIIERLSQEHRKRSAAAVQIVCARSWEHR